MKSGMIKAALAACAAVIGLSHIAAAAQPCGYALYNSANQTDPALYPPYPTTGCALPPGQPVLQPPNASDPFIPNPSFECPGIPLFSAVVGGVQFGGIHLDYDPAPGHVPNYWPTPGFYGGNTFNGDNRFITGWEVRAGQMEYHRNASDGCYSIDYWSGSGWIWTTISQLQSNALYDLAFDVQQSSYAHPPVFADVALTARIDANPPPAVIMGNFTAASVANSLPATALASQNYTNSAGFIQVLGAWQTRHLYFRAPAASAILSFYLTNSSNLHAYGSTALIDNLRVDKVPSLPLTVAKIVTTAGPATPPPQNLTFAVAVSCGSVAAAPDYDFHQTLAVSEGAPQIVPVLSGATCSVSEDLAGLPSTPVADPGCPSALAQWGAAPPATTITVTAALTVTVENTYACVPPTLGDLHVQKMVVNNTTADLSTWQYPVTVTCGADQTPLTLAAGGAPGVVSGVVVGTQCSISENAQALPVPDEGQGCPGGTTAEWNPASYSPANVAIGPQPSTIVVTNTLNCVSPPAPTAFDLKVTKTVNVVAPATPPPASQTFNITATCAGTAYPLPMTYSGNNNQQRIVPQIATGATCTVLETGLPTAARRDIACPSGFAEWGPIAYSDSTGAATDSVVMGTSSNTLSVTNTYACKARPTRVDVQKIVENHTSFADGDLAGWAYPVKVKCGGNDLVLDLTVGNPTPILNQAVGTLCKVTEDPSVLALPPAEKACPAGQVPKWSVTYAPDSANVGANPVKLVVINALDCVAPPPGKGALIIKKAVTDLTNGHAPPISFKFQVNCGSPLPLQTVLGNNIVQIPLPTGVTCHVTEVPLTGTMVVRSCPGTGRAAWVQPPTYSVPPSQGIPITAAGPSTVVVTNTFKCLSASPPSPTPTPRSCDAGLVLKGDTCVPADAPKPLACKEPFVPNKAGTDCTCPTGTVETATGICVASQPAPKPDEKPVDAKPAEKSSEPPPK